MSSSSIKSQIAIAFIGPPQCSFTNHPSQLRADWSKRSERYVTFAIHIGQQVDILLTAQ